MATKEKTTTSWADETDDYEDTEVQAQKPATKAWSKGNPLVKDEKRESSQERDNENHQTESKDNQEPRKDRDEYKRDREAYPRERRERKLVPFPETAPFIAFVGNLVYDVNSGELANFFEDKGCRVARDGVKLMINKENNKPKGKGYVEFEDIKSLQRAVSLSGEVFLGRDIRVDVAERKEDRPRRDFGRDRRDRGYGRDRPAYNNRDRSPQRDRSPSRGEEDQEKRERPKINLLPRTAPAESGSPETQRTAKANPFGDAKPRDENAILKKKEEEKKQRETVVSKPESPAKEAKDNHEDNKPPREDREHRAPREGKPRDDKGPRRDDRPRRENRDDRRGNGRDNKRGGPRDDRRRGDNNNRDDNRNRDQRPLPKQEVKAAQVQSRNIFAALGDTDE